MRELIGRWLQLSTGQKEQIGRFENEAEAVTWIGSPQCFAWIKVQGTNESQLRELSPTGPSIRLQAPRIACLSQPSKQTDSTRIFFRYPDKVELQPATRHAFTHAATYRGLLAPRRPSILDELSQSLKPPKKALVFFPTRDFFGRASSLSTLPPPMIT
jgi:hypothetical protein